MFKVFIEGEVIGGTMAYQADVKSRVAAKLEARLNTNDVESVICVTPVQDGNEFQLVAVVKVGGSKKDAPADEVPAAPEKKKTKGGK